MASGDFHSSSLSSPHELCKVFKDVVLANAVQKKKKYKYL